jgi:ribosomal protein S18 acetylase RimI-like enzyme
MITAKPRIRAAERADHASVSRLIPELAVDDPIPDEAKFVDHFVPNTLIAEGEEGPSGPPRVLGYTMFQIIKDEAYVRHIVTAPEARRTGVGRALMTAVAEKARAAACTKWQLNVKPDNAAAIALYESLGLRPEFSSRALKIAWSSVDGAPTPVHDGRISARIITPDDDARVEAAMHLISGQLASARLRAERVTLGLYDGDEVVGAAVFDTMFPGAYPFRAARPELALTLLRALQPYARAEHTELSVVTENQPAVADALIAIGARVKLEILHMSGVLPESAR